MKVTITYKFTQQLSDQIYIETGRRVSEHQETFADEELTPAARKASLSALLQKRDYANGYRLATIESVSADGALYRCDGWTHLEIVVPSAGTVPSRTEALAAVERELIAAADLSTAVQRRKDQLVAEHERQDAERREAELQAELGRPVSQWLDGKPGAVEVARYVSNGETLYALAKLDARFLPVLEAAKAEAERQNAEHAAQVSRNQELELALLREHGTPSQVERYAAGVLPEGEFRDVAIRVLFAPLADLPKYVKLTRDDVAGELDCDCDSIKFANNDGSDEPLTAEQWDALQAVKRAAPEGAVVDVREHRGYCDDNDCEGGVSRLSARVTIEFAGERYRQEYAI